MPEGETCDDVDISEIGDCWVTSTNNRDKGLEVINDVISFNDETTEELYRFDGIHLDIEFSEALGFDVNKEGYFENYLALMESAAGLVDVYNGSKDPDMTLGVDYVTTVPTEWYSSDLNNNSKLDYKDVF